MIKNHTSSVPAAMSVVRIEQKLIAYGATDIMKKYGPDKQLVAVAFSIDINGAKIPVFLPARASKVYEKMRRDYIKSVRKPNESKLQGLKEQAERTAWKLVQDWVDVQLSLIELDQVEMLEVFLPFVCDPATGGTFFEHLKANGFKQLSACNG